MPNTQTKESLTRVSALAATGRENLLESSHLNLQERKNLNAIQVLAFAGQYKAAAKAISKALGIECPITAGVCHSDEATQVIWNGPNSWMVISSDESSGDKANDLFDSLEKAVGKLAAVVDQSHGRCGLRLSGKHARAVMTKNCALDLHSLKFSAGHCAMTSIAHMSALVVQVDDTPTYDLFVARSLARSFAHAIEHACAEFINT